MTGYLIRDVVNRADLADRAPASSTFKRRADQNLAVSALASLIPVDRRLDGGFRLKTGRGVFGLGVVIAPTAQFVGIALEMRVHVTRHQFVAPLRRGPVRPVVR